jgi:hypothetical protein
MYSNRRGNPLSYDIRKDPELAERCIKEATAALFHRSDKLVYKYIYMPLIQYCSSCHTVIRTTGQLHWQKGYNIFPPDQKHLGVGIFLSPDILVCDVHFIGRNFWNFQETFRIVNSKRWHSYQVFFRNITIFIW